MGETTGYWRIKNRWLRTAVVWVTWPWVFTLLILIGLLMLAIRVGVACIDGVHDWLHYDSKNFLPSQRGWHLLWLLLTARDQ